MRKLLAGATIGVAAVVLSMAPAGGQEVDQRECPQSPQTCPPDVVEVLPREVVREVPPQPQPEVEAVVADRDDTEPPGTARPREDAQVLASDRGELPVTGTDALTLAVIGSAMTATGIVLVRRRPGEGTAGS